MTAAEEADKTMQWQDDALVLSARRHGETSMVVTLLTRTRGRHAGLVRGGGGRRASGTLQAGNAISATWRGRLPEQLGTLSCELTEALAATVLGDALRLAALSAACAVAEAALPEREPHAEVFEALRALLRSLDGPGWGSAYVKWELGLLSALGFGLDLERCAATGGTTELAYVSPRTGRAVSVPAAAPYRERLLVLPPFLLRPGGEGAAGEVADGLRLTGYFLARHVLAHRAGGELPAARRRLEDRLHGLAASD